MIERRLWAWTAPTALAAPAVQPAVGALAYSGSPSVFWGRSGCVEPRILGALAAPAVGVGGDDQTAYA